MARKDKIKKHEQKSKKIINISLIIVGIGLIYCLMSIVFWGSISISVEMKTGCFGVNNIKNSLVEENVSQLESGQVRYSLFGKKDDIIGKPLINTE